MTIEKDPPLSAAVGAIISERRKRMGLTQAQLAEHLDITQDSLGLSINNLEKMLSFWYAFLQWRQAYEREIMGSV